MKTISPILNLALAACAAVVLTRSDPANAFFAETLAQTHQGDHTTGGDSYSGNGVFTLNQGVGQTSTTTNQSFTDDVLFGGQPQREEDASATADLTTSQVKSDISGTMLVSGLPGGTITLAGAGIGDGASLTRPGGPPFGHLSGDVVTFTLNVSGSLGQNAPSGSNFNGSIIGLIIARPGTLTPALDFESSNWICRYYWGIGSNADVVYSTGGPLLHLPLVSKITSFPATLTTSCPSGADFDWAVYIRTSYAAFAESNWFFDFSHTIDVTASVPDGVIFTSTGSTYAPPEGNAAVFPATDHYLSYTTKPTKGSLCSPDSPMNAGAVCQAEEDCGGVSTGDQTDFCVPDKFPAGIRVTLSDLFEPDRRLYNVKKPLTLDTPANVSAGGVNDSDTHLRGYAIALTPKECGPDAPAHAGEACKAETDCGGTKKVTAFCQAQAKSVKQVGLAVRDQFHPAESPALALDAIKPDRLLVPTSKGLTAFLPIPDAEVDHYKCYKVAPTKGSPKFQTIAQVPVSDQFTGGQKLFDLKKPAQLCMAANKNAEGVPNPTGHLLCYQAVASKGQPKHVPVKGLFLANQLVMEQADTVKEEQLCVPADVELPTSGIPG